MVGNSFVRHRVYSTPGDSSVHVRNGRGELYKTHCKSNKTLENYKILRIVDG